MFLKFQFHKGAIRTGPSEFAFFSLRNFNSIKVRLEQVMRKNNNIKQLNFNSIKVRLEHQEIINRFAVAEFQFHKGAIRTNHPYPDICDDLAFQFHNGAIRTEDFACHVIAQVHFNSIKVRLEREHSRDAAMMV